MRIKAGGLQLRFNTFQQPSTWHTIKTNCIKHILNSDSEIY